MEQESKPRYSALDVFLLHFAVLVLFIVFTGMSFVAFKHARHADISALAARLIVWANPGIWIICGLYLVGVSKSKRGKERLQYLFVTIVFLFTGVLSSASVQKKIFESYANWSGLILWSSAAFLALYILLKEYGQALRSTAEEWTEAGRITTLEY